VHTFTSFCRVNVYRSHPPFYPKIRETKQNEAILDVLSTLARDIIRSSSGLVKLSGILKPFICMKSFNIWSREYFTQFLQQQVHDFIQELALLIPCMKMIK
jgi:hypothetical protein